MGATLAVGGKAVFASVYHRRGECVGADVFRQVDGKQTAEGVEAAVVVLKQALVAQAKCLPPPQTLSHPNQQSAQGPSFSYLTETRVHLLLASSEVHRLSPITTQTPTTPMNKTTSFPQKHPT